MKNIYEYYLNYLDLLIFRDFYQAVYIHYFNHVLIKIMRYLKLWKKNCWRDRVVNNVNEIETLISQGKIIEVMKKDFPDEIDEIEEAKKLCTIINLKMILEV